MAISNELLDKLLKGCRRPGRVLRRSKTWVLGVRSGNRAKLLASIITIGLTSLFTGSAFSTKIPPFHPDRL